MNVFDFGVWIIIKQNLEEVGKFKKNFFIASAYLI